MNLKIVRSLKRAANILLALFMVVLVSTINTSPASAFAGTLENGNMAYAQSSFSTGEACNYLPGFETGYDAWHFVLTARGATFQQSPTNPAVSINLNFVFMRQDNSLFVIKSGAWVQTGKGAYVYTLVQDRIRMVQAGSVALINGLDSGMRLSHTCPGAGSATTPTASPTPTPTATTASPSPTPTATRSSTPTPTPTATTASPTPSPTVSVSRTPTPTASPTSSATTSASPTPTPTQSSSALPTLRPRPNPTSSAIQVRPSQGPNRNILPTPTPTPQGLTSPTPTPSLSPSRSVSPSPSTTPSSTPTPSNSPSAEPSPTSPELTPPVLPTPPPVQDPQNLIFIPPQTPTIVTPPVPPASPIVITQQPTHGNVEVNNNGTITYTPDPAVTNKPVVDVVVFQYTNLSGVTVVVRKEFIVTQKGDVPSIIQTGDEVYGNNFSLLFVTLIVTLTTFGLLRRKFHE
ncbi:MAG: hypothetical protein RL129_747 [Actinomycetota bacterium]|jgi:hypothetical protein